MTIERERSKQRRLSPLPQREDKVLTKEEKIKRIHDTYKGIKEETQSIQQILTNNIIISACSIVVLVIIFPILLQFYFLRLWTYTYNNINIEVSYLAEGYVNLISGIVYKIVYSAIGVLAREVRWIVALAFRIVKFTYFVIISTIFFFLAIFFILSIIMQNKIKFRYIIFSVFVSTIATLTVAIFLIPNDTQIIGFLIKILTDLSLSGDPFIDVSQLVLEIILYFYVGFILLFIIHILIVTIFQSLFR